MANFESILAVVIDELKDIPYPAALAEDSPLGDFFAQIQKQDEQTNLPISRSQIFLRDTKKRLGKFDIFLADLLAGGFATVGDLARAIEDSLV